MCRFILPQLKLNIERWRWNEEYRIYVSTLGHFKDEYKKPIAIKINNNGYCLVQTNAGLRLAHRLVLLTWRPIPDAENLTVDHLDHNKTNNSLNNLEWVTREENWNRAKQDHIVRDSQSERKDKKIVIIGGQREFESIAAAALWLAQSQGMQNPKMSRIEARIENAIVGRHVYGGRKWKRVEK